MLKDANAGFCAQKICKFVVAFVRLFPCRRPAGMVSMVIAVLISVHSWCVFWGMTCLSTWLETGLSDDDASTVCTSATRSHCLFHAGIACSFIIAQLRHHQKHETDIQNTERVSARIPGNTCTVPTVESTVQRAEIAGQSSIT